MADCWKKWLNPFWWLEAAFNAIRSIISGLLGLFGFGGTTERPAHRDIQPAEVDSAYEEAAAEAAIAENADPGIENRVSKFIRYVTADPSERATFDLAGFDAAEQDFILGLSDADLHLLRERGATGIIQAILVKRIPEWSKASRPQEAALDPCEAHTMRDRFLLGVSRLPSACSPVDDLESRPVRAR